MKILCKKKIPNGIKQKELKFYTLQKIKKLFHKTYAENTQLFWRVIN